MDQAAEFARLPERACVTAQLRIHGYHEAAGEFGGLGVYGADASAVQHLVRDDASLAEALDPALPCIRAQAVWAARMEMARTLDDVLARRCRALFLNARAAMRMAPAVAALMARELGRDEAWQQREVAAFTALARQYILSCPGRASQRVEHQFNHDAFVVVAWRFRRGATGPVRGSGGSLMDSTSGTVCFKTVWVADLGPVPRCPLR